MQEFLEKWTANVVQAAKSAETSDVEIGVKSPSVTDTKKLSLGIDVPIGC